MLSEFLGPPLWSTGIIWGREEQRRQLDYYYPDLSLVIEYRERQHVEPVELWDKKATVSGVSRGEQRAIYDQRRRDVLSACGMHLVELNVSEFAHNGAKRLLRDAALDTKVVETRLGAWIG